MKSEKEVREMIDKLYSHYGHVINRPPADINTNAPVALMQMDAIAKLDSFYWVLDEKRPRSPYDKK